MHLTTRLRDSSAVAFQGVQPVDMRQDAVIPDLLPTDDRLWVPLDPGVWTRPLSFDVTHGSYIHVMRVTRQGIIARHRHTGPVHAIILKGEWHYLEHDWVASEGGFAYEPPGETHTLVVPESCREMITVFSVVGALIYVAPDGTAMGYDDVFTRLELTRQHFAAVGVGSAALESMIR